MNGKSSGVELLVVGAIALFGLVALTLSGLVVLWGRTGDVTPLVGLAGTSLGALAALLVRLQGQSSAEPTPVTLEQPTPLPVTNIATAVPAGTGG